MPLLKPAPHHSVTVSRSDAPAPSGRPVPAARPWFGAAAAVLRVLLLQLAAFGLVLGAVAGLGRLPALPPGLLPFPSLSGNERALLALTVLPHAALALLILAAIRLAPARSWAS